MELEVPTHSQIIKHHHNPIIQEDDDRPSSSHSGKCDDSEDERESISGSSISSEEESSSEEGSSDIYASTTDSSDPSSPVTCIPWVGRYPLTQQQHQTPFTSNTKGESSATILTTCDRKRKEHDENSAFQEQDNKIIRSTEPQEMENSTEIVMTDFGLDEVESNEIQSDYVNAPSAVSTEHEENDMNFGSSILTEFDYGIRSVPKGFEPEIQREWERTAAQWHSRKLRSHRPRHYARSSKSFSDAEDALRNNSCNIGELRISACKPSASISIPHNSSQDSFEGESSYFSSMNNSKVRENLTQTTLGNVNLTPLPELDLSTLHHQVESEEPISFSSLSSEQVMLSPRNSVTVTEDYAIPPSPPIHQFPIDPPLSRQILDGNQDSKIHLLSRQIFNYKKQLKVLEKEHAQVFGYKPSHADKINHREMRKCLLHINKAKQELKQIREDPSSTVSGILPVLKSFTSSTSLKQLENTVAEVENILAEDRKIQSRPDDPILMNSAELILEKGIMQKQLLMLEKRHGRPTNKEEKDVVRNLYDRYRIIKKMSSRFTTVKENSLDLVPILEHETLDLQSENLSERMTTEVEAKKSPRALRRRLGGSSLSTFTSTVTADVPTFIEYTSQNQDYNDMELNELERHYKITSEEKRRLRSALRAIEPQSQSTQKRDDKYSTIESEMMHQKYKHTRATLRLLDVLINKRKYPKLV